MDQNIPAQNQPTQQPQQPQAPTQPPQQPPPPADIPIDMPPPGFSPLKKILIIAGIILGIIAIVAVTFLYIVPKFFPSEEKGDVELVYWGVWDDEDVLKDIINAFEKENPRITIKYELQDVSKLDDYIPRVQTRIDDGTGPDIYRFHNSMIRQLVTPNNIYLLPLPEDMVNDTELTEEFYPIVQQNMKVGGAFYGIPRYVDTLSLFINVDTFEDTGYEYPTEWGYFLDLARKLTIPTEDGNGIERPGAALGTYDNVEHAEDIISTLMIQSGITTENFTKAERLEDIVGVLDYYTCFASNSSSCVPVWNESQPNSKLAFAQNKLPMYFGYSYDLLEILAVNPNLNVKILPVPRLNTNNSTVASYWAEGISSKTKHPEEAYKFLKFLTTRENMQIAFANQTKLYGIGSAYPRSDMAQILGSNKYLAPIVKQAENAKPFFFTSNTYDGAKNKSLSKAVSDTINAIITGKESSETAASTLVQNTAEILNLKSPQVEENEE